jgi:hypothetical protein
MSATSCLETRAPWAKRNDSCTPLPLGKGPKPQYDTPSAFLHSAVMSNVSMTAQTPAYFTRSFQDLHASSAGEHYLGYVTLDSYDTGTCAATCAGMAKCQSINIFYERAPTVKLGNDCSNPPSTTLIKCTFWSTAVTAAKATNEGYIDHLFQRVITGSNAYFNARALIKPGRKPLPGPGETFEYCDSDYCYIKNGPPKRHWHPCSGTMSMLTVT